MRGEGGVITDINFMLRDFDVLMIFCCSVTLSSLISEIFVILFSKISPHESIV